MSPTKPLSILIDDAIENDIDFQIEEENSEPEQLELIEEGQ